MQKAIVIKNLIKRYKKAKNNAVDDISLSVEKGEFFAFLGPNGAGKTTTISILTTTLGKTSGEVFIAGFDSEKESRQIREKIGIIFQKPSLDENLTAEENIRLHANLYNVFNFAPSFRLMPQKYKDLISELTSILGIEKSIDKPVKTFSGGMKRKLEIVRSLIHNPEILFLDEPTTGLDPESRKNLWHYLNEIRKEKGTTIFLTTHYLDEAEDAERVVVINEGKIIIEGTPKEIKSKLVMNSLTTEAETPLEFEKELTKMNVEWSKNEGDLFTINLDSLKFSTQEFIKNINSTLKNIDINKPTLEEAYLKIISKK